MSDGRAAPPFDPGLARVIGHPLRQVLLLEYGARVTSPSKVARAIGERLNLVSYHTGVLVRAGCLELVRTEPRRGAKEHFYRTIVTGEIGDREWQELPRKLRRTIARRALELFWRDATRALPRGGLDAHTTHLSRTFLSLDAQGREELAALLHATLRGVGEIQRASRERAGDGGTRSKLMLLHFDDPSAP